MIKEDHVTVLPNLNSDHEEADAKLIALVYAANFPSEELIMVRPPSGDIDILTLFVAHDFRHTKIIVVCRRKESTYWSTCLFWK